MLKKIIIALIGLGLGTGVQANIPTDSVCQSVVGQWTGNGEVKGAFFSCYYDGYGEISSPPVMTAIIHMDKQKNSSHLCLSHSDLSLPLQCHNGEITVSDSGYMVSGIIDGTTLSLNGQLLEPLSANIKLQLSKQ